LGDEVQVPTLDGKVKYTIPEGTQSETVFRLRVRYTSSNGGGRGDQFVKVTVEIPKNLNQRRRNC
jgi:molecular chaperone DnaJ